MQSTYHILRNSVSQSFLVSLETFSCVFQSQTRDSLKLKDRNWRVVFDHCKDVRFQCSLTHGKKGNKPPVFKHQAGQIYNISNRTCPFVIAGIRLNDPGSSCHKRQEETQPTCQTARSTNTVLHLPNTLLASPKCSALACIFFFFFPFPYLCPKLLKCKTENHRNNLSVLLRNS